MRQNDHEMLGGDINGTLDRLQELSAQNELLVLENQKLKDDLLDLQKTDKQKETILKSMESAVAEHDHKLQK